MTIDDLRIFTDDTPLTVNDLDGQPLFIGCIRELEPQVKLRCWQIVSASVSTCGLEITAKEATP